MTIEAAPATNDATSEWLAWIAAGVFQLGYVRRMAGVPTDLSRRFVQRYKGQRGLWNDGGKGQRLGRHYYATFRDLIELRFIHAFYRAGLTWPQICRLAERAGARFGTDYPFSHPRFQDEGAEILGEAGLGVVAEKGPAGFAQIISPRLYESVDYQDDTPSRWYPAETPVRWYPAVEWGLDSVGRAVLVEPLRHFGAPVMAASNIPTDTLHQKFKAEGHDAAEVARWYEISQETVLCAVAFEEALDKRNA